jgi:hypothetical protein
VSQEIANYRIADMQRRLADSVLLTEYERLKREHEETAVKYREQLEKNAQLLSEMKNDRETEVEPRRPCLPACLPTCLSSFRGTTFASRSERGPVVAEGE